MGKGGTGGGRMKCWICGKEMENTIGGCYQCAECGVGIHDGVFRPRSSIKANMDDKKGEI